MKTTSKCISVSEEFSMIAKENGLSWSEAARIGMAMMLQDRGLVEYDNRLNLLRKKKLDNTAEAANKTIENIDDIFS